MSNNTVSIRVVRYKQNDQEYITGVFPFFVISALSEVLVYKQDADGYQRQPNKSHYLKIKNYITNNINRFKLPTTIILGTDQHKIDQYIKSDSCGDIFEVDVTNAGKIFRIVDGQHRIEGIRAAAGDHDSLNNFLLNITILVSPEKHRSVELEAFIDINSTAKKISTDLATLARFDYEIRENRITSSSNRLKHISTKTAFHLKENNTNSVWSSAIKFDIHSEISLGIVGVTLFGESIEPIVEQFLNFHNPPVRNDQLIDYYDSLAKDIAADIDYIWTNIIQKKWRECFSESIAKNEIGELKNIFYSNEYYIQKTLGVKVLNILYAELLKRHGVGDNAKNEFRNLIQNSRIMSKDWRKGGAFSGLSSESGFARIRKMIKNEIERPYT